MEFAVFPESAAKRPQVNRREVLLAKATALMLATVLSGNLGFLYVREVRQLDERRTLAAAALPAVAAASLDTPAETVSAEAVASDAEISHAESMENKLGIEWLPPTVLYWQDLILAAAGEFQVDPKLVAIMMTLESAGWKSAGSGPGARGLMQLMPTTADAIAATLDIAPGSYDIMDPETNIRLGTKLISDLFSKYYALAPNEEEVVRMVTIEYNGGVVRARNFLARLPIPLETRVYSSYAVGMWREKDQPASGYYTRWFVPEHGNGQWLYAKALEQFRQQGIDVYQMFGK